jgi:hypothetical protein
VDVATVESAAFVRTDLDTPWFGFRRPRAQGVLNVVDGTGNEMALGARRRTSARHSVATFDVPFAASPS